MSDDFSITCVMKFVIKFITIKTAIWWTDGPFLFSYYSNLL